MQAVGVAIDRSLKLAVHDADGGHTEAVGMLDGIAARGEAYRWDLMAIETAEAGEDVCPGPALRIEGVDTRQGLGRAGGNLRLYAELLLRFAARQKDYLDEMRQAVFNNDIPLASQLAHTQNSTT